MGMFAWSREEFSIENIKLSLVAIKTLILVWIITVKKRINGLKLRTIEASSNINLRIYFYFVQVLYDIKCVILKYLYRVIYNNLWQESYKNCAKINKITQISELHNKSQFFHIKIKYLHKNIKTN